MTHGIAWLAHSATKMLIQNDKLAELHDLPRLPPLPPLTLPSTVVSLEFPAAHVPLSIHAAGTVVSFAIRH